MVVDKGGISLSIIYSTHTIIGVTCPYTRLVLKSGLAHLNANARDESNANVSANANVQQPNQMQMHLNKIQMHLNKMQMHLYQMQMLFYNYVVNN